MPAWTGHWRGCTPPAPTSRPGLRLRHLPVHPENGEEAFVVRLQDDGTVTAELVAYARPAWGLPRLAPPVLRAMQAVAARAYLRALVV